MDKVKTINNFRIVAVQNAAEIVFQVVDAAENGSVDWEERNYDKTTLQLWTGSGGTGTLLVESVDYEVTKINQVVSGRTNLEIYSGISITNVTYQNVDLFIPIGTLDMYGDISDQSDVNRLQNQIDSILSGTAGKGIGSVHSFATYKDRTTSGLFPFALDNAISQASYPDGYAEIGDMFEEAHIAAGDSASGAGMFYPTPPPGFYERSGVVDSDVLNATDDVTQATEVITLTTGNYNSLKLSRGGDGVPVRVKLLSGSLPGGLDVDPTYFVRFLASFSISLYDTEAHAIDTSGTTGRVDLTDAVGTFSITQEGVAIDDAMQTITGESVATFGGWVSGAGALAVSNSQLIGGTSGSVSVLTDLEFDSSNSPDARTSNETRGKTFFTFYYIKIEDVTPNGETFAVYDIGDASDITVTLPDASLTIVERTFKRTGAGAGKVLFATTGGQTIDGNVPTTYELENAVKDIFTLFPSGGNWFIKIYDLIS